MNNHSEGFEEAKAPGEGEASFNEIYKLEPKGENNKVKGITVCNAGTSRSAIMRDLLKERDYDVENYGVGGSNPFGEELVDAIGRGEIQFILCADKDIADAFEKRFAQLAQEKGITLNVPIRFIDLPEGPGIGWWRNHKDKLDKVSEYNDTSYPKEAYDDVVEYTTGKFDRLGFVSGLSKVGTTEQKEI